MNAMGVFFNDFFSTGVAIFTEIVDAFKSHQSH
jgi:hypothetical protein